MTSPVSLSVMGSRRKSTKYSGSSTYSKVEVCMHSCSVGRQAFTEGRVLSIKASCRNLDVVASHSGALMLCRRSSRVRQQYAVSAANSSTNAT